MKASDIPFCDTQSFSNLILDYLNEDEKLREFYIYTPSLEGIHQAAKSKKFSQEQRSLLVDRFQAQYADAGIKIEGKATGEQIKRLADPKTFTITTGHQLCLMGGPLYFLYKIASIIKLSRTLKEKYTDFDFVPVFWMASEDHDFEEVNHFYFQGEKFQWDKDSKEQGVGRLDNQGLEKIYEDLKGALSTYSGNSSQLLSLFEKAYLKSANYAQATRILVHEMFAEEGVLIIDGDDVELKRSFMPEMNQELTAFSTEKNVFAQSVKLGKEYKLQVNPRQINLFYFNDTESQTERSRSHLSSRERIEKTKDGYALVESGKTFSDAELLAELETHPERFSPNVLMRPMYQEKILPNLAYIGGGGELAYWFQLKQNFEAFGIAFPVLLLRNSVMYVNEKQSKYINDLQLTWPQLFEREGDLIKKWVIEDGNESFLLEKEKAEFAELWQKLRSKSLDEDASLEPHVEAQEVKLKRWLDNLSDKLIRSKRRKNQTAVERIGKLKAELFPSGGLQERKESFIELYLIYGEDLVPKLIESFEIPTDRFLILEI